ncbi:MAG: glycosyltransferase family 39 protein [Chloroflexi bacterium]|nr:glycosyltransferase family 39 protein [Chloroflexota bacterium]
MLVLLLATAVRFAGLGTLPLTSGEADRALAARSLLLGEAPGVWDEPTLEVLVAGAFFLFGESEVTARLVPALAGVLTVALAWLFRPGWGRGPALGAAALLALSPGMVAFSRSVGPESLVAALLLALLWGIERLARAPAPWVLPTLAALLAVLLHLGSAAVTALLVLAGVSATRWAVAGCAHPSALRDALGHDRDRAAFVGVAFLIPFTLIGSGGFLYPVGFGFPSLLAWLTAFEPGAGEVGVFPWLTLALYDPAAVVLGTLGTGAALARSRRQSGPSARLLWAGGGLLAAALVPDSGGLLTALLPLLMLGGGPVGRVWEEMAPSTRRCGGLVFPVAAALGGVLTLGTIHSLAYLNFVAGPTEWFGEPRPDRATLTLLRTLQPRHPAAAPHLLTASDLAVDQNLPAPVRWALRDRGGVRYVSNASEGPALVLVADAPERPNLSGYTARSLPLETRWRPDRVDLPGLWRWFLVRAAYGAAPGERRLTLYQRS